LDLHCAIVARAATVASVALPENPNVDGCAQVLALFGPTSVGKSEIAVALAERLSRSGRGSVIIGADSMQIYDGLGLVSGAASAQQRERADHRLIGFVPIDSEFSAGQYAELAHAEIDRAVGDGELAIVVGGTGLYLQAALTEMPMRPPTSQATEQALQEQLEEEGEQALHDRLAAESPTAAARINASDHRRLLRALALLAEGHSLEDQEGGIWTSQLRHPTRLIGLTCARDELYARIDQRVEEIAAAGAADEVSAALEAGASRTAKMALGFSDLQNGDLEAMKQATRRYAKRQLTWLGKLDQAELIDVGGRRAEEVAEQILSSASPSAA